MAGAERQGREKPTKIEQRKVKGRSEDQSEDFRQKKQHFWLAQFAQGRPRGRKTYKRRSKRACVLSLSLLFVRVLFLSLSVSLSPSLPRTLLRSSTLFSSCLRVGMPSHFKDGFSCYLLKKNRAVTLICLRAMTCFVQDPRAVTCQGL